MVAKKTNMSRIKLALSAYNLLQAIMVAIRNHEPPDEIERSIKKLIAVMQRHPWIKIM